MGSKATDKRRRRLHEALLIAASLAMMLAVAAPVLAQDVIEATGMLDEPEATPMSGIPAITDESSGAHIDDGATDTQVPDDQNGEIEGGPPNAAPVEPAPIQQPDPVAGQLPGSPSEDQYTDEAAEQAAQEALLAAEAAQQASNEAQAAALTAQAAAAETGDVVAEDAAATALEAAATASEASEEAQAAALTAQAAAAEDALGPALQAAREAQQASGAAQAAAQVAQQAAEQAGGADVRDAYTRALEAARSADDNAAFAAEGDLEGAGAEDTGPGEAAGGKEVAGFSGGEGDTGKDPGSKAGSKKDGADEAVGDTAATPVSSKGGAPSPPESGTPLLLLGGSALFAVGAFVARRIFW